MINNSRCFVRIFFLLLSAALSVNAQTAPEHPLVAALRGGGIRCDNHQDRTAAGYPPFSNQLAMEFDDVIHRVLLNPTAGFYFGYDLIIERLPESRQFRVSVRPLDHNYDASVMARDSFRKRNIKHPDPNAVSPSILKPSIPQIINDGDTFAIDLLTNPQTGGKVFDAIKVSFDDMRTANQRYPFMDGVPRDFTLNDVMLSINNFRLVLNDKPVTTKLSMALEAPIVWFYLPTKGRFIFSAAPREGYDFHKIALVESNNMTFTVSGDKYLWSSTSPIIGQGGTWNVWVLFDPDYRPESETATGRKTVKRQSRSMETHNMKTDSTDAIGDGLASGIAWHIEDLLPKK